MADSVDDGARTRSQPYHGRSKGLWEGGRLLCVGGGNWTGLVWVRGTALSRQDNVAAMLFRPH